MAYVLCLWTGFQLDVNRPADLAPSTHARGDLPVQKEHRKIRNLASSGAVQLCREATQRLKALPHEERNVLLVELITDDDVVVREFAAFAIQGEGEAPELLSMLLEHAVKPDLEPLGLASILFALEPVFAPDAPSPVDAALRERFVALLKHASESSNDDLRYQAYAARESSGEAGDAYVEALLELLQERDSDLQVIAAQGLARLRVDRAREPLRAALSGPTELRVHLGLALVALGEPNMREEIESWMLDGAQRFTALVALGDHGDPAAIPLLLKTAKAWLGEPLQKVAAARSAAALGSEEGRDLLERMSRSKRPEVSGFALQSMSALGWPKLDAELRRALEAKDHPAAEVIVDLVAERRAADAREILEAALKHKREPVRDAASEALERL